MILLVTRPEYDYTTRYISAWAKKVIEEATARGCRVLDLVGERASKKELESMLVKQKPSLVFLNGHGGDNLVTGQDEKIIIKAGENEHLLKNTLTYALSCKSAKILGPESVKKGASAYIGYQEDFVFMFNEEKRTRPEDDKIAALFLDPSNQVIISLIKGHTARESCSNGKKSFARNIQKLVTSQTSKADTSTLRYLLWDLKNLVVHEKK